jgi:hypothetical protein
LLLKSIIALAGGAGEPERVARSVAAGAEKVLLRVQRSERSTNGHSEANKKSILFCSPYYRLKGITME